MNDFSSLWNQLHSIWNLQLLPLANTQLTVGALVNTTILLGLIVLVFPKFKRWFMSRVLIKSKLETRTKLEALLIVRYLFYAACVFFIVKTLGLANLAYEQITLLQRQLSAVFDLRLFTLGKTNITIWTTLYLAILSWLLVRVTGQAEKLFLERINAKIKVDRGLSEALVAILRYSLIFIGLIVIVQSAGIDLSALTIIAGAAGLAVGLGLQSIINNLVSGLAILFERPIKVGDRIDVGGTAGDVAHLSLRATTIITNDDIAIIVPNSDFMTSKVVNYTYTGKKCRFRFPVRVSYKSDPQLVKRLLMEAADEHPGVLKKPEPEVRFDEFAESSINFSLSVWTVDHVVEPEKLRSDLNFAITEKFDKYGVQLPSPASEVEFPDVPAAPVPQSMQPKPHQQSTRP